MSLRVREPEPIGSETIKWRLFLLGVVGPLVAVSIGVDGADIFQILAVETLELDPRAVGTALLFGALSIPVQVLAARIPLTRARQNIRLYLWLQGGFALVTALLVAAAPAGSTIAGLVLVVAVLGEIVVSVLFATAWQPLISYTLTVEQRQFMNGRARALTGIAMLSAAVLFGQLGKFGQATFVATLGVAALIVGWSLHILPPPTAETDDEADEAEAEDNADDADDVSADVRDGGSLTNIFIALPAMAFASWPLLVSYAAVTLWPSGNLGILAGALALGAVVASLLWRDPGPRLIPLIRLTAATVVVCSLAIAALGAPIASDAAVGGLLLAVVIGAAARTALRTAVMELAHRRIDNSNAVRVMTMIDVIGSTSFQVGAFIAGFLIAASTDGRSFGSLDPYQVWLVATSAVLVVAAARFRARAAKPQA